MNEPGRRGGLRQDEAARDAGGAMAWRDLRRLTTARVGLGLVGTAQPTASHLDFQEAHALARDAVWSELDVEATRAALLSLGVEVQQVASEARTRREYLLRPDLGRRLRGSDAAALAMRRQPGSVALVVADGLCASGVQLQAPAIVEHAIAGLRGAGWLVAPLTIATQARVALADDIGEALGAAAVAIIIGERPGLSALDSVGIYLTWNPRPGRTDAERNCISNIRQAGLNARDAANKLLWLLGAARRLGETGVNLKDEQPGQRLERRVDSGVG